MALPDPERFSAELRRSELANAWRQGYYSGKRDYAGSLMAGMPISTPNPFEEGQERHE